MSNIEHISEFDTLNAGRNKINKFAIDPANRAELNSIDAKSVANQANQTSQNAEAIAINTDDRLDNMLAGELQDGEVIDARKPFSDEPFSNLGKRLDAQFGDNNIIQPDKFSMTEKMRGQFENQFVDVTWFGAVGNGIKDDTIEINAAIQYAYDNKVFNVHIPRGVYMIRADANKIVDNTFLKNEGGLLWLDGINIILDRNAVLKCIPTASGAYNILRNSGASNISLVGGKVQGDAKNHLGTAGEYGFNIFITGGENILIQDVESFDAWGDGITTDVLNEDFRYPVKNMTMYNVNCHSNGRQGLSLQGNIGFYAKNCNFSGSYRIAPMAGADVEPWDDRSPMVDIVFEKCTFVDNSRSGLLSDGINNEVTLIDCKVKDNGLYDIQTYETSQLKLLDMRLVNAKIGINRTKIIEIDNSTLTESYIEIEDSHNFSGELIKLTNLKLFNKNISKSLIRNFNGKYENVTVDNIFATNGENAISLFSLIANKVTLSNITFDGFSRLGFLYCDEVQAVNCNALNVKNGLVSGEVGRLEMLKNTILHLDAGEGKALLDLTNNPSEIILLSNVFETSVALFSKTLNATTKLIARNNAGAPFKAWSYLGRDLVTSFVENGVSGIIRYNSKSHAESDYHKMQAGTFFTILHEGQTPAYTLWYFESSANVFQIAYK